MQFQITYIEFDFGDDLYPMTEQETEDFCDDYVGTFWEADDGDDLVEEITSAAGYCIKSIDYRHILNTHWKMILYIPEGHGCAYSIDAEGELFYTPILEGGALYMEETDVVDRDDLYSGCHEPDLEEIHSQLIAMNKAVGIYFKN